MHKQFIVIFIFISNIGGFSQKINLSFIEKSDSILKVADFEMKNSGEKLAWDLSYLMESYNKLFELTGDEKYIIENSRLSKLIYKNTDFLKKEKDFRGKSELLWSTVIYSDSLKKVSWIVHTGMITNPIANFCEIVLKNKKLHDIKDKDGDKLFNVANLMCKNVIKSISFHDDEWSKKNKIYIFPEFFPLKEKSLKEKSLPFNQYLALGRTFIQLYQITKKKKYKRKIMDMANHFKSNLTLIDSSYVWKYHPDLKTYEDISHGAIDVSFAYECFKSDLVFDSMDMMFFANTLNKIFVNKSKINDLVFDSKKDNSNYSVLKWYIINPFNPNLDFKFESFVEQIFDKEFTKSTYLFSGIVDYYYYKKIYGVE